MENIDISLISQPSDLFGREILPECTFESEYGKLKLNSVVIPDFSKDKIELELFTKQFDDIKAFIKEGNLQKKSEIAKQISEKVCILAGEMISKDIIQYWCFEKYDFRNLLRLNVLCRLFEKGICLDYNLCREFTYSSPDKVHSNIISYNESPVKHPLMYGTGVYIISMKKAINPSVHMSKWIRKTSEKILLTGLPKNNYLSWALFNASSDDELLSFIQEKVKPKWFDGDDD